MRVHLPRYSIVHYYGENYMTNFDYWTTANDMATAIHNLRVRIAEGEFFTKGIGDWVNISIDREDLEVIE